MEFIVHREDVSKILRHKIICKFSEGKTFYSLKVHNKGTCGVCVEEAGSRRRGRYGGQKILLEEVCLGLRPEG